MNPPIPPTAAKMLADLRDVALHPLASREEIAMALSIAYRIGVADGRAIGAEAVGKSLETQ